MPSTTDVFERGFVSPEVYDAFNVVIGRLEEAIDRETAALTTGRHEVLTEVTRQKCMSFLELDRVMRAMAQAIPSQEIITRLTQFQKKLVLNSAMLDTHLKAAKEVTGLIMRVMRDLDSDGTYSRLGGHMHVDFV